MIKEQHVDTLKNAKVRQEFTANVTHELKTPLTSISGYAELIETGMASEKDVTRFARGIRTNANRLLSLINDILRLSELDSAEEEMEKEQVNLYQLAATCVEMLEHSAGKHKVTLQLMGNDCFVNGNAMMLDELLYNLCDNGIRYNKENGKVMIEVHEEADAVVLVVRDTGIGIPKEHQERIFERFYRVDKSRVRETGISGGSGLGLSIAKEILDKAFGGSKAEIILKKMTASMRSNGPFEFVKSMDPTKIAQLIKDEHPQTIALILYNIKYQQAATVITLLPKDKQTDVARRVAMMEKPS